MRLLIILSLIYCSTVSAQSKVVEGGHVGGGDVTASDLQNFINKIDEYLLSDEGREEYPDLNQPVFHDIVKTVRPVVKNEAVKDEFGVEQTCISHAVEGNRYIQCDLNRLPKIELSTQPSYYRLMFHELLFQVGLEKPISRNVPSDFRVSSKLKMHLKNKQEWVLGENKEYSEVLRSKTERKKLNYQATIHFGIDYLVSTTQIGFSKFGPDDSLFSLRFGQRHSADESQYNTTFQYKKFINNSFYYAPEVFYLNYLEDRDGEDLKLTGIGAGIRVGNQWQWKNFTLGCDWFGMGKVFSYFTYSGDEKNFYTVTLLNVYAGWSF